MEKNNLIALFFSLFFTLNYAFADTAIEQRVQSLFAEIQAKKSLEPSLSYIHWPTEYNKLPVQQRVALGINSADEYKNKAKQLFSGSTTLKVLPPQIEALMAQLPAEQRAMLQGKVQAEVQNVQNNMKAEIAKLEGADLSVIDSQVNGDLGLVKVQLKGPKVDKTDTINLQQINNIWYVDAEQMKNKKF